MPVLNIQYHSKAGLLPTPEMRRKMDLGTSIPLPTLETTTGRIHKGLMVDIESLSSISAGLDRPSELDFSSTYPAFSFLNSMVRPDEFDLDTWNDSDPLNSSEYTSVHDVASSTTGPQSCPPSPTIAQKTYPLP